MNDDLLIHSAKTAQELQDIMLSKLEGKSMANDSRYIFSFVTITLSSLIAEFVDKLLKDEYSQQKVILFKDIMDFSENLLQVKEKQRAFNPGEKH